MKTIQRALESVDDTHVRCIRKVASNRKPGLLFPNDILIFLCLFPSSCRRRRRRRRPRRRRRRPFFLLADDVPSLDHRTLLLQL